MGSSLLSSPMLLYHSQNIKTKSKDFALLGICDKIRESGEIICYTNILALIQKHGGLLLRFEKRVRESGRQNFHLFRTNLR